MGTSNIQSYIATSYSAGHFQHDGISGVFPVFCCLQLGAFFALALLVASQEGNPRCLLRTLLSFQVQNLATVC